MNRTQRDFIAESGQMDSNGSLRGTGMKRDGEESSQQETRFEVSLEQLLEKIAPSERRKLFAVLLSNDVMARRETGVAVIEEEYLSRLPDYSQEIREFFRAERGNRGADEPTISISDTPGRGDPVTRVEDLPVDRYVGRYHLRKLIGQGGFSLVYRAFDPVLARDVAVKVLRPEKLAHPEFAHATIEEARRIAGLNLTGVVPIHDLVEDDSQHYIVTKYLPRGTLSDRIARGRLGVQEACRIVAQIARTLHQAHLKDVIHRDIKPGNILLDDGDVPLVADFGLATTEAEQSREGKYVQGSYRYMSPEQVRGDGRLADARTDIYSLGMVLYELLTGRVAFLCQKPEEFEEHILKRLPRPLRTIDDSIPAELERICLRCLAKRPIDRYLTAADLAEEVEAWLRTQASDSVSTKALPATTTESISNVPVPGEKRLGVWPLAGAVCASLFAVAVVLFVNQSRDPSNGSKTPANPQMLLAANPVEAEYGLWQQRLGARPKELIWPGYRGRSTIGYSDDVRALEVSSDPMRLISLGALSPGKQIVSIGIGQPVWSGGCGLFFDYQEVGGDDGKKEARFEAILLASVPSAAGGRGLQIRWWLARVSPRDGMIYPIKERLEQAIPWPNAENLSRLEIHRVGSNVERIRWAGKDVEFTPVEDAAPATAGDWGLVHYHGTSWFQDPRRVGGERPTQ